MFLPNWIKRSLEWVDYLKDGETIVIAILTLLGRTTLRMERELDRPIWTLIRGSGVDRHLWLGSTQFWNPWKYGQSRLVWWINFFGQAGLAWWKIFYVWAGLARWNNLFGGRVDKTLIAGPDWLGGLFLWPSWMGLVNKFLWLDGMISGGLVWWIDSLFLLKLVSHLSMTGYSGQPSIG